jgi:Domain of unknown function (DUF4403)
MRAHRLLVLFAFGCGTGALYPARPPATPGEALAEPSPSRIVVHATVTTAALRDAIDQNVPARGAGTFQVLGATARYIWDRLSTAISYQQGHIQVQSQVGARVMLPIGGEQRFPLTLRIIAEPVVSSEYVARLQSARVEVTSDDSRLRLAQTLGGALDEIRDQVQQQIDGFALDLKPMINEAYARVAKPIEFAVGEAHACAELRVLGIEAGPTVLADGVEKDVAIVVAPSITMPCTPTAAKPQVLPPLANVALLQTGPFTVELPIAARYEELERAMTMAFTDGKLYFNKEFPALYLEKPEVYASKDQLVVKLHIAGPVSKYGIHMNLDGDLYMSGHPLVVDNELRVPDLQPTIETSQFLLKLKAALDADSIRDQARAALRLDIGERMRSVRDKMSSELSFGSGQGCLRADVNKIAVTGVHAHANYLRLYVAITGQAAVYLPCPTAPPPPTSVSARP